MKWVNDWPVIGIDKDGDGKGEPASRLTKNQMLVEHLLWLLLKESDEFNDNKIGLQWQWYGQPESHLGFWQLGQGSLRLFSDKMPDSAEFMVRA